MQTNAILRIFLAIGLGLVAMILTFQIFTAGGNILGSSFRIITPIAFILGFSTPRFAFYLLLASGGYLDLIKRFMVLDSAISETDLAFILGFAPALMGGMVFSFFMSMISKKETVSRSEVKMFIVITALCCFLGGASALMDGGLRSLGGSVNMVAYMYMPLVIPRIFKSIKEIKFIMVAAVVIYLPAALWAVEQAKYGLANFEMAYLLSGMTIEVRQLDEEIFRNMGTMVSAHALSMVASILIVALLLPISWKTGGLTIRTWFNPVRWACIALFALGAYYTFSRTGWVCAIVAIIAFIVLQSRTLTYLSYFSALGGLVALYLSADYLLHARVMQDGQAYLFEKFGASAEARQALVLGTLDARLESMANFATDKSLWTPFGLKIAGQNIQVTWVHDILSETIIKIGYIPLSLLVIGSLVAVFLSFRAVFRMPEGPHRTFTTYFISLTIGMIAAGFSQGAMILYFPINLFWCLFLGIALTLYHWNRVQNKEASVVETVPEPVVNYDRPIGGLEQARG